MSFSTNTLPDIELFRTDEYYIFMKGRHGLWWNRSTGEFLVKTDWDLASAEDPDCLGVIYGIVGKIELQSLLDSRLVLIKECASVGDLPGGKTVYKIKSIVFLQLGVGNDTADLGLSPCKKHQDSGKKSSSLGGGIFDVHQKAAFAKTWGTIKSATNSVKNTTQQAAALATSQLKLGKKRDSKDREKFEKRLLEELQRIFNDTDSFYFCLNGDLTNSLQRQYDNNERFKNDKKDAVWRNVDDRFFWNRHMLQDLIMLQNPLADPWIVPVIQGFVQIEHCHVEIGYEAISSEILAPKYETFTLILISRRSRYRAGTRYKRRGVDENGKCANYVETEQIVCYHHHHVSFVQVRGSVPVFWSQPGYKYRPPPRLERGEAETRVAFEKHFCEELSLYGPVCIVNLVEQSGKERIIWDAYTDNTITYNNPDVTYVTFDFHEYCRGMHFENVSLLVGNVLDIIKDIGYCWIDKEGQICRQKGVFRVNCIDCLDRTNVVQTALGKTVMEIQFSKLGLIPPEGIMPTNIRSTFQLLWANNGDIISRQYAGTNALKGDYTRTGERKLTGMMKDGMNSANRYYLGHFVDSYRQALIDMMQGVPIDVLDLAKCASEVQVAVDIADELIPLSAPPSYLSEIPFGPEIQMTVALYGMSRYYLSRFKDVYRQATIDMMLGNPVSDEVFSQDKPADEEDSAATAEHVKQLLEDCKKMLIHDMDIILGAWGLIDADPVSGDPTETEMDAILILTRDSYYVAKYDDELDKVTKYQRVLLEDLCLIEFGIPDQSGMSLFNKSSRTAHHCLRFNYKLAGVSGYFHMFRSTNLRFFNNLAVGIKTEEEMIESLKAICEAFLVALEIAGLAAVPFHQGKLEKKKSIPLLSDTSGTRGIIGSGSYLDLSSIPHMTRNVSETQLQALKSVGSKAITNMTQQFNKLNKLSHTFNARKAAKNDSFSYNKDKDEECVTLESTVPVKNFDYYDEYEEELEYNLRDHRMSHSSQRSSKSVDLLLPQVGIVMTTGANNNLVSSYLSDQRNSLDEGVAPCIDNVSLSRVVQNVSVHGHVLTRSRTDLSLDVTGLAPPQSRVTLSPSHDSSLSASPRKNSATTPEITVENAFSADESQNIIGQKSNYDLQAGTQSHRTTELTPPNSLPLTRKLSHSSDEVDRRQNTNTAGEQNKQHICENQIPRNLQMKDQGLLSGSHRSSSVRDLSLNITSSQSESALRSIRTGLSNAMISPVAATKDLVLSPFSKLAKGMQNLGANLDPRKLKGPTGNMGLGITSRHVVTEQQMEEQRKLREKWMNCKSRLVAL